MTKMPDPDARFDLEREADQLEAQLLASTWPEEALEKEPANALNISGPSLASAQPAVHHKATLSCVSEVELDAFHRLMADPNYQHNRSLLNATQRTELIFILQDPTRFKPIWYDPKDRNSVQRLNKLKFEAKTKYRLIDRQLYRVTESKDGSEVVLRQAFVYDAGSIIAACHKTIGHAGEDKTHAEVCKKFYGISRQSLKHLLKQCETCMKMAPNKSKAPLQPICVERAMERLQIDLMDMGSIPAGPYKWILHIKDHFSKYSMLFALTTKESSKIADFLELFIKFYGVPEIIQADNGREFKGAVAILCKRLKIKVINGRPRHPQTQGLVEQANGVAKRKINAWMNDTGSKYWPDALSIVETQMNNQTHTSLPRHLTPYGVFNNRHPRKLLDAQMATDREWIELVETVEESAINTLCCSIPASGESLQLNLARDLLEVLPTESVDLSTNDGELEGNKTTVAGEVVGEAQKLAEQQDLEVRGHQQLVRERMINKYSNQHEIQQFEEGQIVTLKLPIEDRSALDNKRLFCKVIRMPIENKYKLQCEYGFISNLYPTRQLNSVGSILQARYAEAAGAWPTRELTLTTAARLNSTSDRVSIKCSCRKKCAGQKRCQCSKNQQKCTQYCHDAERQCDNYGSVLEGTQQAIITVSTTIESVALPIMTRKRSRAESRGGGSKSKRSR